MLVQLEFLQTKKVPRTEASQQPEEALRGALWLSTHQSSVY